MKQLLPSEYILKQDGENYRNSIQHNFVQQFICKICSFLRIKTVIEEKKLNFRFDVQI